ncbi:MAG: serine/threonine protein kinase [Labilithrix sp.]|nr:serine/threonine protein kinase [Labilithrix sp.]
MTDIESRDAEDPEALARTRAREALVGKTIAGRYVLRGVIGHGGMGAVYEAEHLGLGKRVAVKFIDAEFARDEHVVARFAREARAMSAIESAHIVTVFDAGTDDGRPYLVMELLRGEDLGQRLRRLRRVPVAEAMHVVAQVLKGLARAHAAGIVHRDLKPDNVFLVKGDTDPLFAKIVDFGISKIDRPRASTSPLALTGRGTVLGTPFYMSPEQAQAAPDVDSRTDLYSVGAILFECLTGRPPHTGESYEQIILSICMTDAPSVQIFDPAVPDDVTRFVARSLARDKAQRFTSAERMLAALHEVAPAERARVPLDPPSQQTKLSALDAPGGATVLEAAPAEGRAAVPASRPSAQIGTATRLGVGALDAAGATMVDPAPEVARAPAAPRPDAPRMPARDAKNERVHLVPAGANDGAPRPGPPAGGRGVARSTRPIGAAVATAAVAMLLGVGVTFGVIAALDKKVGTGTAASSGSASPAPDTTGGATTSTMASVDGSTSAATEDAARSAGSGDGGRAGGAAGADAGAAGAVKSASPPTRSPGGASGSPSVRPTAKPLDINRELP